MTTGERHEVMDPLKILGASKADGSLSVCIQTVVWGVLLVDLAVGKKMNTEFFFEVKSFSSEYGSGTDGGGDASLRRKVVEHLHKLEEHMG